MSKQKFVSVFALTIVAALLVTLVWVTCLADV